MKRKAAWLAVGWLALAVGLGAAALALKPESARPTMDEGAEKKQIRAFWEAYNRATDRRSQGEFAQAAEFYEQALALNPTHEDSLYYLGNCLYELGEYARAVMIYERLVEVNPLSNRGLSQLGMALSTPAPAAVLDLARARRLFERAAEINREESGPFLRLGWLALHEGQPEAALRHFLTAAGFKSPEGYFFAGYVKFRQGRYRDAAGYFQKVLEINAREKQISGRGVFSEGDVKLSSGPSLTPLEKSGVKALLFLYWTAAKLGGYPRSVPAEFRIKHDRHEVVNSKSEIRNPKQIQIPDNSHPKRFGIGILNFEIVSNFDIRISDFPAGVSDFPKGLRAVDVAAGDYDGDGWTDVFILRWKRPGLLYRNRGNGTFTDVTQAAGLGGVGGDGFSALFFDYDRDGRPDLLVTSHAPYEVALECLLRPDLRRVEWTPRLFRNRGGGHFEEVTSQVRLDRAYGTMQAAAVDVDQDGWTDVVLANGGLEEYRLEPSVILRNEEGKSFMELAHLPSLDAPMNARTLAVADVDGDGHIEVDLGDGVMIELRCSQGNSLTSRDRRLTASSQK